ncbi:MAG: DUF3592 domain-containing protein [Sedimentisphaerales bacterium]|nr:DUF3592 domain-containing protein [Sedimentisphaerales bacterium]
MARSGFQIRPGHGKTQEKSIFGKLALSLFFLIFFSFGAFFEYLIVQEFFSRLGRFKWGKTSCVILESSVQENPFRFAVRYEYEYSGHTYISTTYRWGYKSSDTYSEAASIAGKYPPDSRTECYVNPDLPSQAVLQRESLWFGLLFLFPLLFVVIGLGGIYGAWAKGNSKEKSLSSGVAKAKKTGTRIGVGFFAIFALAGLGFLVPFFILPIVRILDARDWLPVPCKILRAEVKSHSGDDGTTYSVYIFYQYDFNDQTYKADRYNFMGGSSSGRSGKQAVVDSYRSAKNPVCYVNPEDPTQAVLQRGFTWNLLFGLIPMVFVLVGIGGIIGVSRTARRKARKISRADWLPETQTDRIEQDNIYGPPTTSTTGPVILKARYGRSAKLFGMIFFAVFWNGILSVFLYQVVQGFRRGRPEWFLTVFLIPFVLAGIGVIIGVIYQFLALFNPRVKLILGSREIPIGGSTQLEWEIFGHADRIRTLIIKVTGREEATYQQGTRTYTDKSTFHETEVFSTDNPQQMTFGRTMLHIPNETMHSFKADHNKIIWTLTAHGDIAKWPDMKDTFEITITPLFAG